MLTAFRNPSLWTILRALVAYLRGESDSLLHDSPEADIWDARMVDLLEDNSVEQSATLLENPSSIALQDLLPDNDEMLTLLSRRIKSTETLPEPFYFDNILTTDNADIRKWRQDIVGAAKQRERASSQYLRGHFMPHNPIRQICQRMVSPGNGRPPQRIQTSMLTWVAFSALIYAAVLAQVSLTCIATPLYQKQYFEKHGFGSRNWMLITDAGFAMLFTLEAIIKIVAHGLFFAPHAHLKSAWGIVESIVLITQWVVVGASVYQAGAVSRAVSIVKALRALRLINISESVEHTFYSSLVKGRGKLLSVCILFLFGLSV